MQATLAPPAASRLLHAMDARTADVRLLTDGPALTAIAKAAVAAGGGHVLGETMVVFPNGAITIVLVLAESHLSLHTWPEDGLVAIDLFSCGRIDAELVMAALSSSLSIQQASVRCLPRGAADGVL